MVNAGKCLDWYKKRSSLSVFHKLQIPPTALSIPKKQNQKPRRDREMKTSFQMLVRLVIIQLMLMMTLSEMEMRSSLHDLLKSKGLPGGIFPRGVKSYKVDQEGQLEVLYEEPCWAMFEGEVRFDKVVKGKLSYGGLVGVEGMSQRELFLWFSVKDIIVNDPSSGVILFNLGVAEKQLSLSLFEEPPICKPQNEGLKMSGRKEMGFEDER